MRRAALLFFPLVLIAGLTLAFRSSPVRFGLSRVWSGPAPRLDATARVVAESGFFSGFFASWYSGRTASRLTAFEPLRSGLRMATWWVGTSSS